MAEECEAQGKKRGPYLQYLSTKGGLSPSKIPRSTRRRWSNIQKNSSGTSKCSSTGLKANNSYCGRHDVDLPTPSDHIVGLDPDLHLATNHDLDLTSSSCLESADNSSISDVMSVHNNYGEEMTETSQEQVQEFNQELEEMANPTSNTKVSLDHQVDGDNFDPAVAAVTNNR